MTKFETLSHEIDIEQKIQNFEEFMTTLDHWIQLIKLALTVEDWDQVKMYLNLWCTRYTTLRNNMFIPVRTDAQKAARDRFVKYSYYYRQVEQAVVQQNANLVTIEV